MQLSVIFVKIFVLFLLDSTWNLLRGEIKNRNLARLQARFSSSHSSFQVALMVPQLRQPQIRTSEQLEDEFIVYLAIVVT